MIDDEIRKVKKLTARALALELAICGATEKLDDEDAATVVANAIATFARKRGLSTARIEQEIKAATTIAEMMSTTIGGKR